MGSNPTFCIVTDNPVYQEIMSVGSVADIDVYWDDETFYIYNFQIPEEKRGEGIGTEVMEEIIQIIKISLL